MGAFGLLQEWQKRSGSVNHPPKVNVDEPLEIILGRVLKSSPVTHPRVVEEQIELRNVCGNGLCPGKQFIALSTVNDPGDHARAPAIQQIRRLC